MAASNSKNVELVLADQALTSLRSSGHDVCSAIGEVVDNSLEANANAIKIRFFSELKKVGANKKGVTVVERVAIGDDGDGMPGDVLHRALQLGYSTRYNSRKGMGRFGVGAKLGGISQARRIDIFSRRQGDKTWLHTYIDLDEIKDGKMKVIPEPKNVELPEDCTALVGKSKGTLVLWSKADRLEQRDSGGARTAESVVTDVVNYIARTFRKFLDAGIKINVDGKLVKPHDPLFLMTTTRFHEGPSPDPIATVLVEKENGSFDWPIPGDPTRMSRVEVTMTLLPEKFRPFRGAGGKDIAKERRIDENEGVSILRANREIFFGILRNVQPATEKVKIDRWIGIEVRFQPELDECFAVRNVKKGAEPINGLRDKLREVIYNTVVSARTQIQSFWSRAEAEQHRERGVHAEAEEVAQRTAAISPKPLAGTATPEPERDEKVAAVAKTLTVEHPEREKEVTEQLKSRPMSIVPTPWPGSDFIEIQHLGTSAIVKLNTQHAFYRQVYSPLIQQVEKEVTEGVTEKSTAKLALVGLDLLLLAYAGAEGMRTDPAEYYGDLRSFWGVQLKNMIQEWVK